VSAALLAIPLATVRHDIARYFGALFEVYFILIIAYVVVSILFSVGVRPPYSRWSNAIFAFLRDVVEPYLRLFRRFLPMLGPFDLSPMVGIVVIVIVGRIVVSLIDG
jgi:YggT family protein